MTETDSIDTQFRNLIAWNRRQALLCLLMGALRQTRIYLRNVKALKAARRYERGMQP
jgi:hypothetical protein